MKRHPASDALPATNNNVSVPLFPLLNKFRELVRIVLKVGVERNDAFDRWIRNYMLKAGAKCRPFAPVYRVAEKPCPASLGDSCGLVGGSVIDHDDG
jgi:hypothetical protein